MHLTTSLPVVRSELHLEAVGVQTFVSQQGAQRRTCASNHGNLRRSLPLLSSNRSSLSSGVAAQRLKAAPGAPPQLLPPSPGYDRLYQTTTEEADAPLDIWTVIKPGHVREKIAIFASDGGRADDSRRPSAGGSGSRDRTAAACTNHAAMSGLSRASKAKGSWEENSNAKRRRRSTGVQQDLRTRVLEPSPWRPDVTQQVGGEAVGEGEEERVSVVEMVAFLEQRVSEQQPESKPLLTIQRSSTTITLSRAPPPPPPPPGGGDESEAPESVRVSDMVAKLESDCLRRRTEGSLSRSNSLRRTVGRVLLAGGERSHAPCPPPTAATSLPSSQSLLGGKSTGREPISCSEATPPSAKPAQEAGTKTEAPPPEQAEPVPGLLFLSPPSAPSEICPHPTEPRPCPHSTTFDLAPLRRGGSDGGGGVAAPYFLEMRQRLQQLLEPTPYLSLLPHHLLLQVLLLLPTRSLAALKCTCRYFRFVIDTYAVRPADSLWVSDPRYRDDPCKQCKKRYGRGDVSLCRWHHKPFCQALPYGPGYWMCCHGAHRDTPGCNVGLHDNRWVPAFHSLNVPIYRKGHHDN
ncbi:uncharacterized protein V6R79_020675 [Siganus canaliculatus]